ncbi:maleylpyruvate isomerase family mycothiol-dependent enzyme [Mycobacterium sp. BMJ-28]
MDRAAIIRAESQRLAEVLGAAEPEAQCPTCPDWNALDLLWHLTEVHWFWAQILARDARTEADVHAVEQAKPPRPTRVADLQALRDSSTRALLHQLGRLDDAEPRWTWWEPDQTVGFTRRMQTYEATMHRVDAELTAGMAVGPISPGAAAGAVDHAVDVMWGWLPAGARDEPSAVAEFVASDVDRSWLVDVRRWTAASGASGCYARRAAAGRADVTVTGPVQDLALWAWTRGGSVAVAGKPSAEAALREVVANGM